MITDRLQGKPRQLGDYILERIYTGDYVPGAAIPSIRIYMEQFGMSQRTVQRTVEALVEGGVLESHHGRGTFVKARQEKMAASNQIIAVTLNSSNLETSIYGNTFLGLQQAALETDYQLKVSRMPRMPDSDGKAEINSLIEGTRGLIILSEQDERLRNNKLPVPVVGVCMCDSYDDTVSLFDLDPFSSARQGVDFFKSHGFDKVHILSSDIPTYRMRGSVFAEQWREQGGECETSLLLLPIADLPKISESSALLFTTGGMKDLFLRMYHKQTGIKLEDTCAILELDGKSRINPDCIKTASISLDWKHVGRMVLDEIIFRISSPGIPPRRIFIPGKLHLDGDCQQIENRKRNLSHVETN